MSVSPFPVCSMPPPPSPHPWQLAVVCFPLTSLSLFCLFIRFVHWIPHEIIWCLSFSDWLISLSIMLSRSTHAVAKGKIVFFFYGWVEFHWVNAQQHFKCTELIQEKVSALFFHPFCLFLAHHHILWITWLAPVFLIECLFKFQVSGVFFFIYLFNFLM